MDRKIFKRDFKLHFHLSRKDICARCDFLDIKIQTITDDEEKTTLVQSHDVHLKNVELARKALQEDKILVSKNTLPFLSIYKKPYSIQNYLFQSHYKRNMYVMF